MLKQESLSPHTKKGSPLARTKSKFVISKLLKSRNNSPSIRQQPPPTFNDPLYEHLDGEVLNREQHNFGPWVQHQRLKSGKRMNPISSGELPAIYRPHETAARYFQEMHAHGAQFAEDPVPSLPNIRQRNQRAFSLQNLRPASLQFNPADDASLRSRNNGTKTPFFLKMHGYALPKAAEYDQYSKKSNFIYNYCLNEADPIKPSTHKIKDIANKQNNENYLKLAVSNKQAILAAQISANQLLFRQLKQHRLNKLK